MTSVTTKIADVPLSARGERTRGFDTVETFLERFGYLPPGRRAGSGVADTEDVAAALGKFQRFSALDVTEAFDGRTREAMARPRCGLPDMRLGVAFALACRWDRRRLSYWLDTGTADVPGRDEWFAIESAFATWNELAVLTFTKASSLSPIPEIFVDFRPADDPDLSMVGGILAHADYPPGCGVVTNELPKPIHFDDSENLWCIGAVPGAFDVESVALHEIGHIIGLVHSADPNAIMAPSIAADTVRRELTQDDIDGYHALHARVPNVTQMAVGLAQTTVRNFGLVPQLLPFVGGDVVVSQGPAADSIVAPGSTVQLVH